ncbi:Hypothetical_protein [Hexamita inflata]|uniref:Hypothetical_protein n=1 Tax=Hexamita inflata TaxID=28002 RepID=A0AA86PXN0_9EUKA|nr:Hypothetical protein HINF_LOCUS33308 [Hexamita inflata]
MGFNLQLTGNLQIQYICQVEIIGKITTSIINYYVSFAIPTSNYPSLLQLIDYLVMILLKPTNKRQKTEKDVITRQKRKIRQKSLQRHVRQKFNHYLHYILIINTVVGPRNAFLNQEEE